MFFSQTLQDRIHHKFLQSLPLGRLNQELLDSLQQCGEEERLILEFFYSTMPAADIGDYDFSLYKSFADFGLSLLRDIQWCKEIPEDIFFNYVLHYRINNEKLEDCRPYFYEALRERIQGKGMKEAALEVNIWCAEHVAYQATDQRTASPLAVLKSSYGRCGEESTLTVTAMRSVGIPARQVYTPRWAHCDDNHAWVEVWCHGEWYYLGACEPQPVLNRGWFNNASARAMLVDAKAFLPVAGEENMGQKGQTLILNQTARYADARKFTVCLREPAPVVGALVHFEMLNGSELFPLASVVTDEEGCAGLTLGFGSIHVHAVKEGRFVEAVVDTGAQDSLWLDFSQAVDRREAYQEEFNFRAPKDNARNAVPLTAAQKELKRQINSGAEEKRRSYAKSFYKEQEAEMVAQCFSRPQQAMDILKAAEGNFIEIADFLSMDFGAENKELQLLLLEALHKKDYRDVRCEVLAEHFKGALKYQQDDPLEIFVRYILCPRAYYEQLMPYREAILSLLDRETQELFRKQPQQVWSYVGQFQLEPGLHQEWLIGTPAGTLRSGLAGAMGRRILFVSVCRSLGIPARIHPADLSAQYYKDGEFIHVEASLESGRKQAKLTLQGGEEKWFYFNNWTLAILREGVYQTLELTDCAWEEGLLSLDLEPGSYRLITTKRTPNGNQFARKYCFDLESGKEKLLAISLRKVAVADMLSDIAFSPFVVYDEHNREAAIQEVCGDRPTVLVWLEQGAEPTEHILNEFIQAQGVLNSMDCGIIFMIGSQGAMANQTLQKAHRVLEKSRVYPTDFSDTAVTMARRMYLEPEVFPLAVVTKEGRGLYACSGYHVGSVNLMIDIMSL
jgi:hypothetical protein